MKDYKFYFEHENSEICYDKKYFYEKMQEKNMSEVKVFEAIKIKHSGFFWCKKHEFCGDDTSSCCGKNNCGDYDPRNRVSGCCKHHTSSLYEHGDKVTLYNKTNTK